MECTGKIQSISKDWMTGKFQITFAINEASAINDIEDIKDCEKLAIKAVKYREKRSLDANAYLWVLCTKDEDGNYITITVKSEVDMTRIEGHWKYYKSNGKFTSYLLIKGTSEYNTAEMSHFIDSVVQEAKELNIETMTPAELERMKSAWQSG